MSNLSRDEFVGTNGVTIQSRSMDIGGPWIRSVAPSVASDFVLYNGACRSNGGHSMVLTTALAGGSASVSNGSISLFMRVVIAGGSPTMVSCVSRCTDGALPSYLVFAVENGGFEMRNVVNGVVAPSALSSASYTFNIGETYSIRAITTNSLKTMEVIRDTTGIATTITSTDNTITAISGQRAGMFSVENTSISTGTHVLAFESADNATITSARTFNTNQVLPSTTPGISSSLSLGVTGYTGSGMISQYRLLATNGITEHVPWTNLPVDGSSNPITGNVNILCNYTWVRIQYRLITGNYLILDTSAISPRWGVGIVAIGRGNSNMVGLGNIAGGVTPYESNIDDLTSRCAENSVWTSPAVDPVSSDSVGSMAPAFTKQLRSIFGNVLIGWVYSARGLSPLTIQNGTSGSSQPYVFSDCWNYIDNADLNRSTYTSATTVFGRSLALERSAISTPAISVAPNIVVWCGGDDDVGFSVTRSQWVSAFVQLRNNLISYGLPGYTNTLFVIVGAGRYTNAITGGDPIYNGFRWAQRDIGRLYSWARYAGSMAFATTRDAIHWDVASETVAGRLAARAVGNFFGLTTSTFPEFYRINKVTTTSCDVFIRHGGGTDFTPTSSIQGFTASDTSGSLTVSSATRQTENSIRLVFSRETVGQLKVRWFDGMNPVTAANVLRDNQSDPVCFVPIELKSFPKTGFANFCG